MWIIFIKLLSLSETQIMVCMLEMIALALTHPLSIHNSPFLSVCLFVFMSIDKIFMRFFVCEKSNPKYPFFWHMAIEINALTYGV